MADIYATGEIILDDDKWFYDWLEWKSICPQDVRNVIANCVDEEINLYIDSPGGDVSAASTIRSILKASDKKTKAIITGMAASAATVIMTGCETVEAYNTAILMVHKASSDVGFGNADDMQKAKDMLDTVDSAIANAYVEKTGKSKNEVLNLMKKTTYMDVYKALENGFIDKVIDGQPDEELKAVASFSGFRISNSVKEKVLAFKNQGIKAFSNGASITQSIDMNAIADLVLQKLEDKKKQELENKKQAELNDLKEFSARMEGKYVH